MPKTVCGLCRQLCTSCVCKEGRPMRCARCEREARGGSLLWVKHDCSAAPAAHPLVRHRLRPVGPYCLEKWPPGGGTSSRVLENLHWEHPRRQHDFHSSREGAPNPRRSRRDRSGSIQS
eukprot:scaffold18961_cov95-Phaeocystis_antarctica.AAC.4